MTVFVANSNVIELLGLTDAVSGAFINDATVTAVIYDHNGAQVGGGAGWPMAMAYVANSSGNYRAILDAALLLKADTVNTARINVTAGPGRAGHWEFKFKPTVRTG